MGTINYIGKKWVSGAKGPDEFDCWGMVQHWYKHKLNQDLPNFCADPLDVLAVARTFKGEQSAPKWVELKKPIVNCIVAMGRNSKVTHVGVYVGDNLVLHCSRDAGRCVLQTTRQLAPHWGTIKFYIPNDSRNTVK